MGRKRHGTGGPGGFRRGPGGPGGRRNAARFGGRGIFGQMSIFGSPAPPDSVPTVHGPTTEEERPAAVVDRERCTACGACAVICPRNAITVTDVAQVDPASCTGCGACVQRCPQDAIRMTSRPPSDG